MNLRQFREKYPEYNDLSDKQISDKLYSYYPEMNREEFNKKLGYSETPDISSMFTPRILNPTASLQMAGAETYKNPLTRKVSEAELLSLIPPIRAFHPIINALANIGIGTVATTAMESPDIKNIQDLKKSAKSNLILNSILESIPGATSLSKGFGELVNPMKFTGQKLQEIRTGFKNAKKEQKYAYNNAIEPYKDFNVTIDPKNYFGFKQDEIEYFPSKVKKEYNQFLREPNFSNLHDFQKQLGDARFKTSGKSSDINQAQSLELSHENVKNKINEFLSRDKNALNEYNRGVYITREIKKPYESTKTLRKISKGNIEEIEPKKLMNAINIGKQLEYGSIPKEHLLNIILNELEPKINRGEFIKELIPHHVRGYLPNIVSQSQNPFIQHLFENLNPLYYGIGRTGISNLLSQ